MTRQFFGTDGIRGRANSGHMTAEVAIQLGMAAGTHFRRSSESTHRPKVVIAKDTRLSGYLLEPALTSGFISVGMDVILVGPLPTPAVAMLTKSMRADLGVMLSASHNPYHDNGIKLFNPDGEKLTDAAEAEIEALMQRDPANLRVDSLALGRATRIEDASGRYIELVKNTFPDHLRLDGLRIVLDCAHGAAYKVAPVILRELGAEVFTHGIEPDGFNINEGCGSTHPETMLELVRRHRADVGIALDGDADRIVMSDERGQLLDGDQILAMTARFLHSQGRLPSGKVVATHMSNLGFEEYLTSLGLELIRTNVGDRYVIEAMRVHGCNLGGEQSGHILLTDYSTTGDGLLAGLQVLAVMQEKKQSLSACANCYTPFPQRLTNIRLKDKKSDPTSKPAVQQAISEAEAALKGKGRIFIRKSGTEPLLRVMVEARESALVNRLSDALKQSIEAAA
jgi:phosphoglucosamine mutase